MLARHYAHAAETRGEFVIVVGPPPAESMAAAEVDALLAGALQRLSVSAAVAEIASVTGLPRRAIYQRALALSEERNHGG
jgi:16S rRNA (cytidine1402-2'-O)-methyltransferase